MTGLREQITEVRRELAMRRRVYPRWVAGGRIVQAEADLYMERMQAVLVTLEGLWDAEHPRLDLGDGKRVG